jgi:hypothetical protein
MNWDVFISHASEDKESFVVPLATILDKLKVKVWFDQFTLKVGDSLSRSIDKGLAESKYGIVVISKSFMTKDWTEYELRGLVSKEIGREKVILPVWHGVGKEEVLKFSPTLADKFALNTSNLSLIEIAYKIIEIVRPDIYENILRLSAIEELKSNAKTENVKTERIELGPIKHEKLPDSLLVRIKFIYNIIGNLMDMSLKEMINNFRRDLNPHNEVDIWERVTVSYLEAIKERTLNLEEKCELFSIMLRLSMGALYKDDVYKIRNFNEDEIKQFIEIYENAVPEIN